MLPDVQEETPQIPSFTEEEAALVGEYASDMLEDGDDAKREGFLNNVYREMRGTEGLMQKVKAWCSLVPWHEPLMPALVSIATRHDPSVCAEIFKKPRKINFRTHWCVYLVLSTNPKLPKRAWGYVHDCLVTYVFFKKSTKLPHYVHRDYVRAAGRASISDGPWLVTKLMQSVKAPDALRLVRGFLDDGPELGIALMIDYDPKLNVPFLVWACRVLKDTGITKALIKVLDARYAEAYVVADDKTKREIQELMRRDVPLSFWQMSDPYGRFR